MGYDARKTSYPNGIVSVFGLRPQTISALAELVIQKKPKIAQLILKKRIECDFVSSELEETERGSGGFGSTDSEPVNN
jgi:hypothetical protein